MKSSSVVVRPLGALVVLLLASTPFGPLHAQGKKGAQQPALQVSALAGQSIAVLPLTYVVLGDSVHDKAVPAAHAVMVSWTDSIVAEEILARAPEVTWVIGAELRRKTRSAPGMIPAPDKMGQAALRFENIKKVPDPLFGNLRTLVALSSGRLVLIPTSLRLTMVDSMVQAETMWVLADGRTGSVIWRSAPKVMGRTAAEAIKATVDHIFPDAH